MKYITLIFYLSFSTIYSQNSNLKFIPLVSIDTISNKAQIDKIRINNDFEYENIFIKDWTDKNKVGHKALFYKKGDVHIVYDLPDNDGGNFSFFELSDNNRFISYSTSSNFGSRGHFEATRTSYIFDLKNISIVSLRTFLRTENYDFNKEKGSDSKCEVEIELKSNILTVKRKVSNDKRYKEDFGEDCSLQSGKYKIVNGSINKIKSNR